MLRDLPPPKSTAQPRVKQLLASRHEVVELLAELRRARAVLTCFLEGSVIPAGARIGAILPSPDTLILVPVSNFEQQMFSAAGKVSALVSMHGVKIRFDSTVMGCVETAIGIGVRVSMPAAIVRLQRRAHGRTRPPRVRPLECMVRGETNRPSPQRLFVLDIGIGGVALLGRAEDRFEAGERLLNCSFNLGQEGGFTTDLLVRDVRPVEISGGWRYGCAYADITARALERVCSYVERIEARRTQALATTA